MIACEERTDDVLRLLSELEGRAGLQPDLTSLTVAIRSCEQAGRFTECFELNRRLSGSIQSRPREFDRQGIERAHRHMDRLGLRPVALTFAVLVADYSKTNNWKAGCRALHEMAGKGIKFPLCTLDTVVTMCTDAGRESEAQEVLQLATAANLLAVTDASDGGDDSPSLPDVPGYYDMLAGTDFAAAQR